MTSPILILHAPDAEEEAAELRSQLELLGFWSVTYYHITRRSLVKEIRKSRAELLASIPALIVLSSAELFSDPFLIEWASLASFKKILIPVVFRHEHVPLPSWFTHPIQLSLAHRSESVREWTRLSEALTRRTGQGFSYLDPHLSHVIYS